MTDSALTYKCTQLVNYRASNGKMHTISPKAIVSREVYLAVPTSQRNRFQLIEPKRTSNARKAWSADEAEFAVDTYLERVDPSEGVIDRTVLAERFIERFPERGYQGVSHALHQIRTRDIYVYQGVFTSICGSILRAMYDADPEGKRFYLAEQEIASFEAEREAIFKA